MSEQQPNTVRALRLPTPIHVVLFADPRYWSDGEERRSCAERIYRQLGEQLQRASLRYSLVDSEKELRDLTGRGPGGTTLFVAMSGGVQAWMLQAAQVFDAIGIFPGYLADLIPSDVAELLLERNASPSSLEVFSVLKNGGRPTVWAGHLGDFLPLWKAEQAVRRFRQSKILLVGETEPWVLSSNRDLHQVHDRLGIRIEQVALEELYRHFEAASERESRKLAESWLESAEKLVEPRRADVYRASRLIAAFETLMAKYAADGVAIACFTLLHELETTSCLAMSYLNDLPAFVGACEGDLDAAATLTLVKSLTDEPAWMGNPIVGSEDTITIVHCTAPLRLCGAKRPYQLRSHHESGIGVSPEVRMPTGGTVTLCRIGAESSAMTVQTGEAQDAPRQPTCRTQLRIRLPSLEDFLARSLGNHQVLSFGDHVKELRYCARLLGLELR